MRKKRWKLLVCFLLTSGCGEDENGELVSTGSVFEIPAGDTISVNAGGENDGSGTDDPTDSPLPRRTPPPIHMSFDDVPAEAPGPASETPEGSDGSVEVEETDDDATEESEADDETPEDPIEEPEEIIESDDDVISGDDDVPTGDDDTTEDDEAEEESIGDDDVVESEGVPSSDPSCAGGVHHYVVTMVNPDGSAMTIVVICGDPESEYEEPPADDDETPEDPIEEPEEVIESDDDVISGDDDVPTGDDSVEGDDTEEEPVGDDDAADPPLPVDQDGDGFVEGEDCDDLAAVNNPGAVEVCDDGIDNNCNGFADRGAEVDGCVVSEEPIEDPTEDDPTPTEVPEESEPSVTVASSDTTQSNEEPQVVTAGSEGVVLGRFDLGCSADGCLVKSITLQVEVDNMSYDVNEIVGRCRLNQVEPEEMGIGGPRTLDSQGKYVSTANFWLEIESVPQFVLLCDLAASVPTDAVRVTAYLVLEETEVWDQDSSILPLSCASEEGNPVIGVVSITPP